MPVTQQDIAEKLGVSRRLVSYALNGENGVGAEMRAKILTVADEMGYRTNRTAKALVTGRTHQIALCLPSLTQSFHAQFIQHFETLVRETPYDLLVSTSLTDGRPLPAVDGILLHDSRPLENALHPTVMIQSPPGRGASVGHRQFDQVFLGLARASQEAMQHLLQRGKPRVALVTFHSIKLPDDPRLQAYNAAMQAAGLPPEIISFEHRTRDDMRSVAQQALEAYFTRHGFPDALFCCNDDIAIGAYRVLRKHGRRVPEQTAVVGCDDVTEAIDLYPSLTSIKHAWEASCRCAWDMLLERIENPQLPPRQHTFQGELVIRESSAL